MLWVFIMLHYEHIISTKILVVGNRLINVCHIYLGYTLNVPDSAIVRTRAWADFKLD